MVVVAVPIAWRPAHLVLASSASEQRLPRWRWSIAKALERVTESDLMLASPARVFRSNCRLGSLVRAVGPWPPSWRIDIFGAKGSVAQLTAWKGEEKLATVPWSPIPCEATEKGRAVGRVDHEVRLVDIDLDRAHPDRDPADDLGHGFGVGDHVGVERIDVQGDADDDGAVVIGAGQRRGDRDQAERRALEGPGEVDLARPRGRGASPGRRRRLSVPISELAGQLGSACSVRPGVLAAAAIEASGQ